VRVWNAWNRAIWIAPVDSTALPLQPKSQPIATVEIKSSSIPANPTNPIRASVRIEWPE
jgi:hypothetical protein